MTGSVASVRPPFLAEPVPIGILRVDSPDIARSMARALRAGGMTTFEVTFSVPNAVDLVRELAVDPEACVGAGTVTSARQLEDMVAAGVRFVVSPGLDEALVRRAAELGVPLLPGVMTPTEVMAARRLGVRTLKLFPASTLGVGHMKALTSVFPEVGFVPTGGVGVEEAPAWLRAGARALGVGGVLNSVFEQQGAGGLQVLAGELVRLCQQARRRETMSEEWKV